MKFLFNLPNYLCRLIAVPLCIAILLLTLVVGLGFGITVVFASLVGLFNEQLAARIFDRAEGFMRRIFG